MSRSGAERGGPRADARRRDSTLSFGSVVEEARFIENPASLIELLLAVAGNLGMAQGAALCARATQAFSGASRAAGIASGAFRGGRDIRHTFGCVAFDPMQHTGCTVFTGVMS